MADPANLVADDVVLLSRSEAELQAILDTCTSWAVKNGLEWQPQKWSVVVKKFPETPNKMFQLAGKIIPLSTSARYLGIMVTHKGFTKAVDRDLEKKCVASCAGTTSQPFFDSDLPFSTIPTLIEPSCEALSCTTYS